jgi:hypothetical protein
MYWVYLGCVEKINTNIEDKILNNLYLVTSDFIVSFLKTAGDLESLTALNHF